MFEPFGLGAPALSMTGEMYQRMRAPVVYAWMRDGVPLYVGVGKNGIDRPFSASHHVFTLGRIHADDTFLCWSVKSRREALRIEGELIRRFRPKFNLTVDDAIRFSPRQGHGLWRRDRSWVVEFVYQRVRYKKSLGHIPLDLAKKLAAEYRLSVIVKNMPVVEDRPINGYPLKPKGRKATARVAAPSLPSSV